MEGRRWFFMVKNKKKELKIDLNLRSRLVTFTSGALVSKAVQIVVTLTINFGLIHYKKVIKYFSVMV